MIEFSVDLKWSLWTINTDTWEERAPGVLGKMAQALEVEGRVTLYSMPKKEIRFGSVVIKKWPEGFHARVEFSTEWDEPEDLLEALNLNTDRLVELEGRVPRNNNGEPGVTHLEECTNVTLEGLFDMIENAEGSLLEETERAWKALERQYDQ